MMDYDQKLRRRQEEDDKFKNFGKDDEGAFIRVIPVMNANEESLKRFTALWIDSAVKTSNGYY